MRLILVGADFEENLGLCMLSAAATKAGHAVSVTAFDDATQTDAVVERVLAQAPDVVGLGIQFQHRASEFLCLGSRLRAAGFRGHLTCGGQFPTMAWEHVLAGKTPFDSVVLYDGERTLVELLGALERGAPIEDVAGLAIPAPLTPRRTAPRALEEQLDALPVAKRYRPHGRHAGIPFIPMTGGRGCWGKCTYCAITTVYRDARESGGGKTVRLRSARSVADEMAVLWHAAGGAGIFCFHDDNFLLPRKSDTIARVSEMRARLDELGVGRAAFVGKARPDCIDHETAKELATLGVVRLYVGVENVSDAGSLHLGRERQTEAVREALAACREAGIFTCYNLLVFEPETRLDDVRANIAFMREHPMHPVNFCRAEPYHGTPLHRRLEREGKLRGSVLGWDYQLEDERAELLFRICSSAFRNRNFGKAGVANRNMGLGYIATIAKMFYGDDPRVGALVRDADQLTRAIGLDTAEHLEKAVEIAATVDLADRDRIERLTAQLGLQIGAADRLWHARLDTVIGDIEALARSRARTRKKRIPPRISRLAEGLGVAAVLGMSTAAMASGCGSTTVDPVPTDAGKDVGPDWMVVDALPPDAGMDADASDATIDVVDPPPPDAGVGLLDPTDQWRDTTPRRAVRSQTLPLFDPPDVRLAAVREDGRVRVTLHGGPAAISTRWEAEGSVAPEKDRDVVWTPASEDDTLTVAVRSRGGVSTLELRACDVGQSPDTATGVVA